MRNRKMNHQLWFSYVATAGESRTTNCRSRITIHAKAQWPNKAILSQTQGRNGAAMHVASRGVGACRHAVGGMGKYYCP